MKNCLLPKCNCFILASAMVPGKKTLRVIGESGQVCGLSLLINERIDTRTADRILAALPRFPGASGVQRLRPVSEADLRQVDHYHAPRVAAHRD